MRITVATAALAAILMLPSIAAAEWQGREVVHNGIRHIENPETPMERLDVDMVEVWRRGAEDDDIFFGLPSQIVQDGQGNVYVLDAQVSEIHVFSPDGEHLRTIGREGEGPGEFRNANDMFLGPGNLLGVVSVFPGKIVRLGLDGTPADNFPLPQEEGEGFQLVFKARATKDRVVVAGAKQTRGNGSNEQSNYLKAFDSEGNELAHYHTMMERTQYGGMEFDEKVFANFKGQWALAPSGEVAGALTFDDYALHVWNPDATAKFVIERPDYPPYKRTAKLKERMQKLYDGVTRWNPNSTFKVSETHRAVVQLWYREDGNLWVLSGRGNWHEEDGLFAAFDVYDSQGRYIRQVRLVGDGDAQNDGIYFVGKRLFRVSNQMSGFMANIGGDTAEGDDAMEPLQVVAYDIDLPELGSSR